MRLRFYLQIGTLNIRRWRIIAAIQPDKQARVVAKTQHLRAHGFRCDLKSSPASIFPVLPMVAAAPAQHNENALLVGEVEKVVRLHLPFEPNRIQMHVAHQLELDRADSPGPAAAACPATSPRRESG